MKVKSPRLSPREAAMVLLGDFATADLVRLKADQIRRAVKDGLLPKLPPDPFSRLPRVQVELDAVLRWDEAERNGGAKAWQAREAVNVR